MKREMLIKMYDKCVEDYVYLNGYEWCEGIGIVYEWSDKGVRYRLNLIEDIFSEEWLDVWLEVSLKMEL